MSTQMQPAVSRQAPEEPYPGINVVAAVIIAFVAPLISLIAALVLRQDQRNRARREQLSAWAVASGIWLALGAIILISVAASIGSAGAGGCKGGINHLLPPSYASSGGGHWTATYQCWNGGTTTRPAQAAWLNTAP